VAVEERREDEFNRRRAARVGVVVFRVRRALVATHNIAMMMMTTTIARFYNAFGRPPRVDGRALDVFALLNLAGFRVPDERVGARRAQTTTIVGVVVARRRRLPMGRHQKRAQKSRDNRRLFWIFV